jgi:predicted nucleic acid-binding protein
MRRYLLDTTVLVGYLQGRLGAIKLVDPWLASDEVVTSIIVYGEVIEYLKRLPDFAKRRAELRQVLKQVTPLALTYTIMERYADLRRALRPPYGPGLIGDMDTLVAATAIEHGLTLVTTDGDFTRVPNLAYQHIPRAQFQA